MEKESTVSMPPSCVSVHVRKSDPHVCEHLTLGSSFELLAMLLLSGHLLLIAS